VVERYDATVGFDISMPLAYCPGNKGVLNNISRQYQVVGILRTI